ncbi:GntR family transcriptional regulator [Nitratireductor sp.]|uniref:GntR family transcriptional regulator n=1 Tax=Nitratireductor sp. TaxID=1872084 RepID=UPI0025D2A924|nr:GntR family transcriptional regulator [Nitratireductor sp.]
MGDEVYERLLASLISLKIPPGSRISVDALARKLKVSQTPIRAALIRLETQGLVVSAHNVGYSAAPLPTANQFSDMYDFRLLVEPPMARRAAERTGPKEKKELTTLAGAMQRPLATGKRAEYGRFALSDSAFHLWVARKGGNTVVVDALERLHIHSQLFRLRYHSAVTSEAIKEHDAIVQAIVAGDGKGAHRAMEQHIIASRERMEPFFKDIEEEPDV